MFEENLFENVLKSFRVRKGKEWTQKRTAELLEVGERTYKSWENGERLPDDKNLKKIVVLFKLKKEDEDTFYRAATRVSPQVHNIGFLRNTFFTGREKQIEHLEQLLKENGSVAITQPIAISGLGGIVRREVT